MQIIWIGMFCQSGNYMRSPAVHPRQNIFRALLPAPLPMQTTNFEPFLNVTNEALKDAGLMKFVKGTCTLTRKLTSGTTIWLPFIRFFFCFSQPICVVLKMKVGYHSGGRRGWGGLSISFVSKIVFAAVQFIMCMSIKIKKCKISLENSVSCKNNEISWLGFTTLLAVTVDIGPLEVNLWIICEFREAKPNASSCHD